MREFPEFLRDGDLVVLNDTRVIPARVFSDDGRIEFLFLEMIRENVWKCLVKPGRKMRIGAVVQVRAVPGVVEEICPEGERIIAFSGPVDLDAAGELPLPPYFERKVEPADAERYQTVFARERGAVAAPTAGLHFTPEMLARIPARLPDAACGSRHFSHRVRGRHHPASHALRALPRLRGNRRCRERRAPGGRHRHDQRAGAGSCGLPLTACEGSTDIFIHPPYQPRAVGALLTNFHLPKSTLLMLVSAFAGREFVLRAYAEAIRERYRFFSYGDCMLVV